MSCRNRLPVAKQPGQIALLLRQLRSPIVYVLLASAAVAATILRMAIVAKRWAWHPEARAR